jgi:hypothetical protein
VTVITPKFWVSPTWIHPVCLDSAIKTTKHYCNVLGKEFDTHVVCDAHYDVQRLRKLITNEDAPDAHLIIGFEDWKVGQINSQRLRDAWFNIMGFSIINVRTYDDTRFDGDYSFWNHKEYRSIHGCPHKQICRRRKACTFRHTEIKIDKRTFKLSA